MPTLYTVVCVATLDEAEQQAARTALFWFVENTEQEAEQRARAWVNLNWRGATIEHTMVTEPPDWVAAYYKEPTPDEKV